MSRFSLKAYFEEFQNRPLTLQEFIDDEIQRLLKERPTLFRDKPIKTIENELKLKLFGLR